MFDMDPNDSYSQIRSTGQNTGTSTLNQTMFATAQTTKTTFPVIREKEEKGMTGKIRVVTRAKNRSVMKRGETTFKTYLSSTIDPDTTDKRTRSRKKAKQVYNLQDMYYVYHNFRATATR